MVMNSKMSLKTLLGKDAVRSPVKNLTTANKLPPGHYARALALEAVNQEYALCREQEKEISKTLKKRKDLKTYYKNVATAKTICDAICDYWMVSRIKKFVLNSRDVDISANAHYCRKEIHFSYSSFHLITLIHELAHHFSIMDKHHDGHGKDFLLYEKMIAETFLTLF